MSKQRNYSTEFKRRVVLEYLAGETLHGLAKRHDVSRNVIRLWVARYEADGELNDNTTAADLLQDYKARIAALERLAGKLALEVEFLRGPWRTLACRKTRRPASLPARRSLHQPGMHTD